MRISVIPTLLREILGKHEFNREPEPDLVMQDKNQVAAFAEAGRIDGIMSATYLFNTTRISQIIQDCNKVLDLGCGPATQLAQIAQINPQIEFIGVDMSENMLKNAKAYCDQLGVNNISFVRDDISTLNTIPDNSVDAVISTLALHHLPSERLLKNCFRQIRRVLRTEGALFLMDLSRLKSLYSVLYFAYLNKKYQPAIFTLDYERSLRAAFSSEEFKQLAAEIFPEKKVQILSTALIPILTIIKTEDKTLPQTTLEKIRKLSENLPKRYRNDLHDIRFLFKLSGLKNDPFSSR
ncbi:Methyltransferase domain-containing protein [Nitrosomonas eutropha]|uniref:class I SAM-dependent methyltransferase n=1 Tax=Nitrosomonas TaxID=914 RepID=UPI00089B02EC|nr:MULTISPECIES: class I SAM-dependent methyltransferase [Nitrosomonas]MXS79793.1 class I SAM-dependent methyltransferase [Nitrosomonas sp. GH22]SDW47092.1 Methyltransferase domain-containing protein [Nitrosomonas eutropha]